MHVDVLGIWLTSLSLELSKTLLAEFATSFARPRHGLDTLSTQTSDDLAESYLIPDVASRPISTHLRFPSLVVGSM